MRTFINSLSRSSNAVSDFVGARSVYIYGGVSRDVEIDFKEISTKRGYFWVLGGFMTDKIRKN
jgi:hypothetical protein